VRLYPRAARTVLALSNTHVLDGSELKVAAGTGGRGGGGRGEGVISITILRRHNQATGDDMGHSSSD
jgi:hypothetical protein